MKHTVRLLIVSAVLLSSAFLIAPDREASAQGQTANHMELTVNYDTGEPGSIFTVFGRGWLEYSTVTIFVNDKEIGKVETDISGNFVFQLDTSGAEEGFYVITTDSIEPLSARVWLHHHLPLRMPTGVGGILELPPEIAMTMISLPMVVK